jgi:hypothetical protein
LVVVVVLPVFDDDEHARRARGAMTSRPAAATPCRMSLINAPPNAGVIEGDEPMRDVMPRQIERRTLYIGRPVGTRV